MLHLVPTLGEMGTWFIWRQHQRCFDGKFRLALGSR